MGEWIEPQPVAAEQNLFRLVEQPSTSHWRRGSWSDQATDFARVKRSPSSSTIITRQTPVTASVLPLILDRLAEAGAASEDIRLVIALGGHP